MESSPSFVRAPEVHQLFFRTLKELLLAEGPQELRLALHEPSCTTSSG